jgi:endonuclease/exonuclease/phosphatase family metal-dependent hydrolase
LNLLASEGNAILFKNSSLTLLSADSVNYAAEIPPLPLLGAFFTPQRGAIFAKFKTDKQTVFSIFTTHLEDGSAALAIIGDAQAVELASFIDSKAANGEAQFLTGDFNQTPGGARITLIKSKGFLELYSDVNPTDGETCCYDVADTTVPLTEKIDYIFGKNIVSIQSSQVRLNGSFAIPGVGGFRVSDHAGVGAWVTFH